MRRKTGDLGIDVPDVELSRHFEDGSHERGWDRGELQRKGVRRVGNLSKKHLAE